MPNRSHKWQKRISSLLAVTTLGALIAPALQAQSNYEYEADEGWHQEEWYDPSDWFDDDYSYDYDANSYGEYWNDDLWEDSVATNNNNYSGGYYYDWSSDSQSWKRQNNNNNGNNQQQVESQYDYDPAYVIYTFTTTNRQRQQDSQQMRDGNRQGQNQQAQSQQDQMKVKRLKGQIEGFRQMELQNRQGDKDQFTVVKLSLQDGRSTVVSLGRTNEVQDLDLQQGDRVQLMGSPGQIDGQPVFVARKLRVNDQTVDVNRAIRRQDANSSKSNYSRSHSQRNRNDNSSNWNRSASASNSSSDRNWDRQQNERNSQRNRDGQHSNRSQNSRDRNASQSYTYNAGNNEWSSSQGQRSGATASNQRSQGNQPERGVRTESRTRYQLEAGEPAVSTVQTDRNRQRSSSNYRNQQQSDRMDQVTLRGRVEDFHTVSISRSRQHQSEDQTVVRLRLENGESALVSLGSDTSLSDLDLQRDDQIMVRGERQQWGNGSVVQADRIRVEGNTVKSSS
ncbi:MAG: hypothetical protein E1N59_258 [Puniceicoccaceae bacterium 5H]|nr:MAG: hypothetical protein E1N59_258 [Puniceicoccaceae bacterium 5H]